MILRVPPGFVQGPAALFCGLSGIFAALTNTLKL